MRWAPPAIGRCAAIVLLLPLGGCIEDQVQQVALCEAGGVAAEATLDDTMRGCMANNGYEWYLADPRCGTSDRMSRNPFCYQPSGRIARYLYQVQRSNE